MTCRCPNCHSDVNLDVNDPHGLVECPSCGGHFELVASDSTAHYSRKRRIVGRFELLDQVGAGKFGSVWKAHDSKLDRFVAIKIPRSPQIEPEETEQFVREARAAAQVTHPNIVHVHEVCVEDDSTYIVSDFVEGANLKEYVGTQSLSAREASQICATIADALHAAHESGVIHRDLKPHNIMMDRDGVPYVADFGLAKRDTGEITMTLDGQILGTPAYMPPEQIEKAHQVDPRADVYSLGVVLFELLTGELPFRGQRQMILLQIQRDDPPSPRRFDLGIPRDLETICLKCLRKNPCERYESAAACRDDLRRFISGEPIAARPIGNIERCWRWIKRHPVETAFLTLSGATIGTICLLMSSLAYSSQLEQANTQLSTTQNSLTRKNNDLEKAHVSLEASVLRESELRERLDRILYLRTITLAQTAFKNSDLRRAQGLIKSCPPRFRNWEWRYLNQLFNREKSSFPITKQLTCLTMDRGGKYLAKVGKNGPEVFDLASGELLITLDGEEFKHQKTPRAMVFNHDASKLIVAGRDKQIRFVKWRNEKVESVLEGHRWAIACLALSPDGDTLISGGEYGAVRQWDLKTMSPTATLLEKPLNSGVKSLAFHPRGSLIVVAGAHAVFVVDTRSQKIVHTLKIHPDDWPQLAMFSGDGKLVIAAIDRVGPSKDDALIAWDSITGQMVYELIDHDATISAIDHHPTAGLCVTASRDRMVAVRDSQTGKRLIEFPHQIGVSNAFFHPTKGSLITACGDRIREWDVPVSRSRAGEWARKGDRLKIGFHFPGRVRQIAFTPNGRYLGGVVHTLKTIRPNVSSYARVPSSASVKIWDTASWDLKLDLGSEAKLIWKLSFSPDSRLMATANMDGSFHIWDLMKEQIVFTKDAHPGGVTDIEFDDSGDLLATTGNDGFARTWSVSDCSMISERQYWVGAKISSSDDGVSSVHYGRRFLVTATAGSGFLFTTSKYANGGRNGPQFTGFSILQNHGEFMPTKMPAVHRLLSIAGTKHVAFIPWNRQVQFQIYNTETNETVTEFVGHFSSITGLAGCRDGSRIVTSDHEGMVRVWDVLTGVEAISFSAGNKVHDVCMSPQGDNIVAVTDSRLIVWPASSIE